MHNIEIKYCLSEFLATELKNVTPNTKMYKVIIENTFVYVLVEFIADIDENLLYKEIYKAIQMNTVNVNEAIAVTYRSDIKIFIYGKQNEFINQVITESEVCFEKQKEVTIRLDYSYRVNNNIINNEEEGIIPVLSIDLESGSSLDLEIAEYSINNPLYMKDGKIFCDFAKLSIPKINARETEHCSVTLKAYVDNELRSFDSWIDVLVDNTEEIQSYKDNTLKDIELIADALFEIDAKLLALDINEVSLMRTITDKNAIANMWVRWIKTNRKTIDECPEKYVDYVKSQLKE